MTMIFLINENARYNLILFVVNEEVGVGVDIYKYKCVID